MRTQKTIVLEILRHGIAYRQLLSPATEYQALCGNHEAASVTVPFTHAEFMQRIRSLRYEREGPEERALEVRRTAEDLARVFEQIPGLINELAARDAVAPGLLHLRLILSAPELALLPFELGIGPAGFPGAGSEISLQAEAPLSITREARRISGHKIQWPTKPRILFAAASPPKAGPVPLEAHLLELRRAIDPWIRQDEQTDRQVGDMLTVLPQASLEEIQRHCAEQVFTHVHVLAHGAGIEGSDEYGKFGLALHDRSKTSTDVVDGKRLADALRAHRRKPGEFLASPTVVTLASCDSGNVGDVTTPGSSMAHTLHAAGIPFVVASQFPLTVAGSVTMTSVLYRRLLWGEDPRVVLHDVRQQLHQMGAGVHDWASLVAYAALPSNLDEQLEQVRSEQARRAMGVAMSKAEAGQDLILRADSTSPRELSATECKKRIAALGELERAMEIMPPPPLPGRSVVLPEVSGRSEESGIRGATEKRRAWVHHVLMTDARLRAERLRSEGRGDPEVREAVREGERHGDEEQAALARAFEHYRDAFRLDMATHWAAVQYLGLGVVIERAAECPEEHWAIARAVAQLCQRHPDRVQRAWAHASLLELSLLELERKRQKPARLVEKLADHWSRFCEDADREEMVSTERQLRRYAYWWKLEEAGRHARDLIRLNAPEIDAVKRRSRAS